MKDRVEGYGTRRRETKKKKKKKKKKKTKKKKEKERERKRRKGKRKRREKGHHSSMFTIAGLLRHFPPLVIDLHVILQIASCHVCSSSVPLSSSHLPGSQALHFGLDPELIEVVFTVGHMCGSVRGNGLLSQARCCMLGILVCQKA